VETEVKRRDRRRIVQRLVNGSGWGALLVSLCACGGGGGGSEGAYDPTPGRLFVTNVATRDPLPQTREGCVPGTVTSPTLVRVEWHQSCGFFSCGSWEGADVRIGPGETKVVASIAPGYYGTRETWSDGSETSERCSPSRDFFGNIYINPGTDISLTVQAK
jgi:hypothetical protein